jgi:hypothetical protein
MNGCKYIKKRVDEAEKPDLLPFDVSEHLRQCVECGRFASERSALRELLSAGTRVSAPINFDAMLKARLSDVKARRSLWWLGSPGYLRLGAVTAGLVVMIFAAQYAGLFSDNVKRPDQPRVNEVTTNPIPNAPEPVPVLPGVIKEPSSPIVVAVGRRPYQGASPRTSRGEAFLGRAEAAGDLSVEDGGVVLVRGRNGELDVQMPTVSVGAQPLLYVSAGQRTVRNVGASF